MQARGRQAEDQVAGEYLGAVDDVLALDDADREARQVVLVLRVHAGHLRGLAAEQDAAKPAAAALHDAGDDALGAFQLELAGGVVVEEDQGLGAAADQVVDAHGDEVDADRVVPVEGEGELELGADAVGAGDEVPGAVAVEVEGNRPAKPPMAGALFWMWSTSLSARSMFTPDLR